MKKETVDNLIQHFVDTTAIVAVNNPIRATIELFAADMPDSLSMTARFYATLISYAGLGSFFSRTRDYSQRIFNIGTKKKDGHDALYGLVFTAATQPIFYYFVGCRSEREIFLGTLGAMGMALFLGPLYGRSIDAYRDLTGIQESKRLPGFIKNQSPTTKNYIAGLLTATSVGTLAAIYGLNK